DEGPADRTSTGLRLQGGAAGVVHRGLDLANIGVNAAAENHHLQYGHQQRKDQGHAITAHVPHFLVEDCRKALKRTIHDTISNSACRRRLSSTNASSSVGSSGRTSSTSIPRPRSSCSSSSAPTDSSTNAWIDRPKIVALFRTVISLALRSAVVT